MSQVKFKAATPSGNPIEVMGGWDKPLRMYFLAIFDLRENAEEETLWDSMDDGSEEDFKSTARLQAKLRDLGIEPPPDFWALVERQERNVVQTWSGTTWTGWADDSLIPDDVLA